MNGTSNEYDLQTVYNANSGIGVITELSHICLAMNDTTISPFTYTGTETVPITDNQISLNFLIQINDEVVLHPRNYDNTVFDMVSGADMFAFRQNSIHGGQPIAIFKSSTKS